jgi:hypothetical protein
VLRDELCHGLSRQRKDDHVGGMERFGHRRHPHARLTRHLVRLRVPRAEDDRFARPREGTAERAADEAGSNDRDVHDSPPFRSQSRAGDA